MIYLKLEFILCDINIYKSEKALFITMKTDKNK